MGKTLAKSVAGQRRALYVAICSDCDPDRESYGGSSYSMREGLRWEGVRVGVVQARDIARRVGDETGCSVRMTWCVRSDAQMQCVYGDAAWAYKAFAGSWEGLAEAGDEIAWHPHVWRWDDAVGCWYQEISDEGWTDECLGDGYRALRELVGEVLVTSRMGWEYHSDTTMRAVAGLGIANDCSAIPGWFAAGEASHGSRFHCHADWQSTPRRPYMPSRDDYRLPAGRDADALGIREFPMSTFPSSLWGGVRRVRKALRLQGLRGLGMAFAPSTWRPTQVKAYATIRPDLFRRLVAEQLEGIRKAPCGIGYLLTAFHPDELLSGEQGRLYSSANFEVNLRAIVAMARGSGVEPVFVSVSGLGAAYGSLSAHPSE
jgi:hypothetical protein